MKVIDLLIQKSKGIDFKVIDNNFYFKNTYTLLEHLNDEVEVIEDKKIEKINVWYHYDGINDKELTKIMLDELKDKVNTIIDKLNGE